jgi:hypothetical protein
LDTPAALATVRTVEQHPAPQSLHLLLQQHIVAAAVAPALHHRTLLLMMTFLRKAIDEDTKGHQDPTPSTHKQGFSAAQPPT